MEPQFDDATIREHHRIKSKSAMSEGQWTAGQWETVHEGHRLSVWAEGYGFVHTHEVPEVNRGATLTANANSRLISAAPDLYDALQEMLGTFAALGYSQRIAVQKAFAAIGKADGK